MAQQKWIQLVSMRIWVQSLALLSGSGIQRCLELWCRSKTRLGCRVAVAVVQVGSCGSDSTPSLRISICCRYGPKKQRKKKDTNNKCWQGCGEKGALVRCWWEWKLVVSHTMENSTGVSKTIKPELPYGPAAPLPGIYSQKAKTLIQKDICTPMFIAPLLIIAKM